MDFRIGRTRASGVDTWTKSVEPSSPPQNRGTVLPFCDVVIILISAVLVKAGKVSHGS